MSKRAISGRLADESAMSQERFWIQSALILQFAGCQPAESWMGYSESGQPPLANPAAQSLPARENLTPP